MKMHKNIVGGVVVMLLFGSVGFLLFKGINRLSNTRKKLEKSMMELSNYYRNDPFPSEENVAQEKKNVEVLQNWFGELIRNLREGQIEPKEDKSPSTFMDLLGDRKNGLIKLAKSSGAALPKNFAFGFDRYFASSVPPAPDDVPRLTQQLTIIEDLCKVLLEERVKEIVAIGRSEFEDKRSRAASDIKNADTGGMDDLYTKMHFVFEFKAKENSVWSILNCLTSHHMFIIPTLLQFEKQGEDILGSKPKGEESRESEEKAADRFDDFPSRRERLVCGQEFETPMMVKLEVDVYTFLKK